MDDYKELWLENSELNIRFKVDYDSEGKIVTVTHNSIYRHGNFNPGDESEFNGIPYILSSKELTIRSAVVPPDPDQDTVKETWIRKDVFEATRKEEIANGGQ